MDGKMKALVTYGPGDYRLTEVDIPTPAEGEILVKVEACGICAGDAKAYGGAKRFWGSEDIRGYIEPPCIPGHEFIGRIVEMGSNADSEFQVGDRVISEQIKPCGICRYCRTGRYWLCQPHDVYGFKSYLNGGMAEYMIFPKGSRNYKVPEDLPTEKAILIEPYACSKHCVDRAAIGNEDIVVLAGCGTLGLGMVSAAALRNPACLIAIDLMDERLEIAKAFGADMTINPGKENAVERILSLTEGYGCDIYIEATGHPAAVNQGLEMIRKQGTFVEFSVFGQDVVADWSIIGDGKELTILGSHLSAYAYPTVIDWIQAEKMPTEGVVTHVLPLAKWEEGFRLAGEGTSAIKVVLIP